MVNTQEILDLLEAHIGYDLIAEFADDCVLYVELVLEDYPDRSPADIVAEYVEEYRAQGILEEVTQC